MNTFDEFLSSSGRKLSPMQMEVVESDVATVVSAGAGSGKTTVLSYRFLRLVMEKKASADEQIKELINWGVHFDKNEKGDFDLHKEGGS